MIVLQFILAERSQNGQYFQRRQAKRSPDCRRPAVWRVGDPFTEANLWAVRLKCAWVALILLGYAHALPTGLLGSEDNISM